MITVIYPDHGRKIIVIKNECLYVRFTTIAVRRKLNAIMKAVPAFGVAPARQPIWRSLGQSGGRSGN
ncbi:MAG TPA: hypothetical protein VN767_28565, partial [Streptosporangiaceae bacterium]|nr:hypothetical protein [Streptosporangiaceae bacterium]